jgi:hypothetical protein
MNRAQRIVLCVLLAAFAYPHLIEGGNKMGMIANPIPHWQIGDWWIVRTTCLENLSTIPSGPEHTAMLNFYHRFEIVREEMLRGEPVWVIEIKATKLPADVINKHGDGFLWRLYLRKHALTLARIESNTRFGMYCVEGDEAHKESEDHFKNIPARIQNITAITPLDIPKLPSASGEYPRYLFEDEKSIPFTNEETLHEMLQTTIAASEIIENKEITCLTISLSDKSREIVTEKWIPGLPWWSEWSKTTIEGPSGGMIKAVLVDHGKKR